MKNNNESGKSVAQYLWILVVMCAAAIAATGFLWVQSEKYRSMDLWAAYDQKDRTLEGELQSLNALIDEAQSASFGFYYLLQKKISDYPVTPSDVFRSDAAFDWNDEIIVSDADAGQTAEFDLFVQETYYNFIARISSYSMDYYIEDHTNRSNYLTSVEDGILLSTVKKKAETAGFYLALEISSDGVMQVEDIDGNFTGKAEQVSMTDQRIIDRAYEDGVSAEGYPRSMTIYLFSDSRLFYDEVSQNVYNDGYYVNCQKIINIMGCSAMILGLLNIAAAWILLGIKKTGLREGFLTRIPFEISFCLGIAAIMFFSLTGAECSGIFVNPTGADISVYLPAIIGIWAAYFGVEVLIFLAAGGIASVALLGPVTFIRERTLFWKCMRWIKKRLLKLYEDAVALVFDAKKNTVLVKLVLLNAVIVALICCFWFAGIFGVIIYSILVFIAANQYLKKIQQQYDVVHKAAKDMADGHLDTDLSGSAGIFEPIREALARVREGLKITVEEEVRSQKMKTELITNVSHDLKTPLTAIITYTNLLKDENISDDDRRRYVAVLDQKAERLKRLIDDLFEVSKANSGNIKVNKTWLDVSDLVRQATIENEDKLKNAAVDLRVGLPGGKTMLELDGQKMYRIMDNLLGNVAKYSLPGTRAYVSVIDQDSVVTITVKNISAGELPEDVSNLTERFVRGDVSRHTEGSGLGLAIAKSFTELMGGTFTICTDGDLFKATVVFMRTEADLRKAPADTEDTISEVSDETKDRAPETSEAAKNVISETSEAAKNVISETSEAAKNVILETSEAAKYVISETSEAAKDMILETSKETEAVLNDSVNIEDVLEVHHNGSESQ